MYEKQSIIDVDAWAHSDVNEQPITDGLPFRSDFLLESCPLVVSEPIIANSSVNLLQISELHLRSFEVGFGNVDQRVLWGDEYGNMFTCLNTKGNSLVDPYMYKDRTMPGGIAIYGLQDGYTLERIISASAKLREAGIDTEAIVRVMEPQDWLYQGEFLETDDFKRALIEKAWAKNSVIDTTDDTSETMAVFSLEELANASQAISETGLFVTVRAQKINERLQDIMHALAAGEEQTKHFFKRVFEVANLTQAYEKEDADKYEFQVDDPHSIEAFFNEYLPSKIGRNIAKMHNLGLSHDYLNTANISILGGIYDLDCVEGAALGFNDETVGEGNLIRNLDKLLSQTTQLALEDIFSRLHSQKLITEDPKVICENFRNQIIQNYLIERCGTQPTFEGLSIMTAFAAQYGYEDNPWFRDLYDTAILTLYNRQTLELEERLLSGDVDQAIKSVIETFVENSLEGVINEGQIVEMNISKEELAANFRKFEAHEIAGMAVLFLSNDSLLSAEEESPYSQDMVRVAKAKVEYQIESILSDEVIQPIVYKALERQHTRLLEEAQDISSRRILAPLIGLPEKQMIVSGNIATVIDECPIEQALEALTQLKDPQALEVIFRYPVYSLFPPMFMMEPEEIVADGQISLLRQGSSPIFNVGPLVWHKPDHLSSYKLIRLKDIPSFSTSPYLLTTSLPEPQIRNIIQDAIGDKLKIYYTSADDVTLDLPDGTKLPIVKYI